MLENGPPSKIRVLWIVLAAVSVPVALALMLVYRVVSLDIFAVGLVLWLGAFAIWTALRSLAKAGIRVDLPLSLTVLAFLAVPIALIFLLTYEVLPPRIFGIGMVLWFATFMTWAALRGRNLAKKVSSRGAVGGADLVNSREWLLLQMRLKKQRVGWLLLALPVVTWYGIDQRWGLLTIGCVAIDLFMLYLAWREIRNLKARLNVVGS